MFIYQELVFLAEGNLSKSKHKMAIGLDVLEEIVEECAQCFCILISTAVSYT